MLNKRHLLKKTTAICQGEQTSWVPALSPLFTKDHTLSGTLYRMQRHIIAEWYTASKHTLSQESEGYERGKRAQEVGSSHVGICGKCWLSLEEYSLMFLICIWTHIYVLALHYATFSCNKHVIGFYLGISMHRQRAIPLENLMLPIWTVVGFSNILFMSPFSFLILLCICFSSECCLIWVLH